MPRENLLVLTESVTRRHNGAFIRPPTSADPLQSPWGDSRSGCWTNQGPSLFQTHSALSLGAGRTLQIVSDDDDEEEGEVSQMEKSFHRGTKGTPVVNHRSTFDVSGLGFPIVGLQGAEARGVEEMVSYFVSWVDTSDWVSWQEHDRLHSLVRSVTMSFDRAFRLHCFFSERSQHCSSELLSKQQHILLLSLIWPDGQRVLMVTRLQKTKKWIYSFQPKSLIFHTESQ